MRTLRLFLVIVAATTAACGGCSDSRGANSNSNDSADLGRDAVVPTDAGGETNSSNDSGGGFDLGSGIDPEFLAALPRDHEGNPVIFSGPSALAPGVDVIFSVGGPPEDPIGYRASCLRLFLSCQEGPDFDASCVSRIPVCSSPAGGLDCCPQSCASQLVRDVSEVPARQALDNLLSGDCIDGFDQYVNEFGLMEPVFP